MNARFWYILYWIFACGAIIHASYNLIIRDLSLTGEIVFIISIIIISFMAGALRQFNKQRRRK